MVCFIHSSPAITGIRLHTGQPQVVAPVDLEEDLAAVLDPVIGLDAGKEEALAQRPGVDGVGVGRVRSAMGADARPGRRAADG